VGICGNQLASFATIEISGLVLDTTLLVLPIPVVIGLKTSRIKKLKAIVILDIGAM
jgi:hypothetical protein